MGYYTGYEFSVHEYGNETVTNSDIAKAINDMHEKNEEAFYPLFDGAGEDLENYMKDGTQDGMGIYPCDVYKWYDADVDMLALSRMFSDTVFCLHGVGEEDGDLWDTYYKNGKSATYQAVIPPFDPKDLK